MNHEMALGVLREAFEKSRLLGNEVFDSHQACMYPPKPSTIAEHEARSLRFIKAVHALKDHADELARKVAWKEGQ